VNLLKFQNRNNKITGTIQLHNKSRSAQKQAYCTTTTMMCMRE
ncbi:MAG: hypothetical protein ACI8RD_011392, partial [Bacillariaceae sp.]